jgi:acyl-CoA thioester hydrolase
MPETGERQAAVTSEGHFVWPVRVYYEDTDAGGIVYYANYLKFMERARTEWLRALGFEQDRLREEAGILFAVSRVAVDYVRPARFNERLLVSVKINQLGRASMSLAQEVCRESGEVLCTGLVRIVCLDAASLRPRPMPATVVKEIEVAD